MKFNLWANEEGSFKEKLLRRIDSPVFLRWAALTSLFMVIGLFTVISLLAVQIKSLRNVVSVHDQILAKIAKGELPLLQKEDGEFVPAMQFILVNLKNQSNQIDQLISATPTPTPNRFKF